MRIGIDLDGVGYDFNAGLWEYLRLAGIKTGDAPKSKRWEFYLDWGLTLDEFLQHCNDGVDKGVVFSHGAPIGSFVKALQDLRADGHTLHIVTDRTFGRPGMSAVATIEWLAFHGVPYDTITFSSDKTIANIDMMIDDKPSNYEALEAAGVKVFLMERSWNYDWQDKREEIGHNVNSVSTMMQFVSEVRYEERQRKLQTAKATNKAARRECERLTAGEQIKRVSVSQMLTPGQGGEVRTTSATGGQKGVKPERHSLIPKQFLDGLARVYAFGAKKYADHNWRKGYEWSKSYDAAIRHLTSFWDGETLDPESGLCHLDHAAFHLAALRTWLEQNGEGSQFDDRYKKAEK